MELNKQIREAIQNENLVIFVGSGLSKRFNLPDWKKLVSEIIKSINKKEYNPFIEILENEVMSPLDVLDFLSKEHYEIHKYIKDNFNLGEEDFTLHKKILDLTGKIVTTNYDNAFEKASENKIQPTKYDSKFNVSEINKDNKPFILKLHGCFSEPDSCVVFKKDYEKLYSEENAAIEKIKSFFSDKLILFLGFGFNDPNLSLIFSNLDIVFGNNNKHYALTTDSDTFNNLKFIETITLNNFEEVDLFIDECLKCKVNNVRNTTKETKTENEILEIAFKPKFALLSPSPIDLEFKNDLSKLYEYFEDLLIEIHVGTLNLKTLSQLDNFDLIIIVSKTFKNRIYIENDYLKSDLLLLEEIYENIPNEKIPIVFITDTILQNEQNLLNVNISSYKKSIINRFIYKALKNKDLNFFEPEINTNLTEIFNFEIKAGKASIFNIYGNNRDLDIGKKCLDNIVGRVEEQSVIANRLLNITKSNKFLNIKASGGIGKTTIIKKVAYELYNRGYFKEGVTFRSCENVKQYENFEDILYGGFNFTNIINFKEHLIQNYSQQKIDSLIILDNFETVVNNVSPLDFAKIIELLKFSTDYTNIVLTSREKITKDDDFEDIYNLTPLTTDDALELFIKYYGEVSKDEIKILRSEILEEILNNNPLAIKLVTTSRTRFTHIFELKSQLIESFFESTNEDFSTVFENNADLNIEKTKSIFQSINYSFITLNEKEKLAFELLNLFPDGISLSNFKKCFKKQNSENGTSDRELKVLKNKSLVEDYNGTLQLQPIIRRFAQLQFSRRSKKIKQKYSLDAYKFNCFILELLEYIKRNVSLSESLRIFNNYKNNLLNVINYMLDIEISDKGPVSEKKYLLNYIYDLDDFIINIKNTKDFITSLEEIKNFFSDIENAEKLITVLKSRLTYYQLEFDSSYKSMCSLVSSADIENRLIDNEEYIERRYKDLIGSIHSMEGYTIQYLKGIMNVSELLYSLDADFYYLGLPDIYFTKNKFDFYYFENQLKESKLNINELEKYILSLHPDEHLEKMQCTYTLTKVMKLDEKDINKLVVTNPYSKGLKKLMLALIAKDNVLKNIYFEAALKNLYHIKYYYLEALYYYCLFLREIKNINYEIKLKEGIELSSSFYYQYINHLFISIENPIKTNYNFDYSYYPISGLEEFIKRHNESWEKRSMEIEN